MITALPRRDVLIAGGGPAGLSAALALARSGAAVTLVERDILPVGLDPDEAVAAERTGIAHYHAPHAFLPRGAKVMRERLPDIYATLLEHGAYELRLARDQPDERPEDADLILLCVRRPLIEWALREAVFREPGIELVDARIDGLVIERGRVAGLSTSAGDVHAPVTVDAMGRTSRSPRWLAEAGIDVPEESHDVGLVLYCRYHRLRQGRDFPASPHAFGPRGDLGYAQYATFPGDNGTFGCTLYFPAADTELKAAKGADQLHACFRSLPELSEWVAGEASVPITGVIPMGALRTVWRAWDAAAPTGFVAVADSFCHTDPSFALGLSLGLVHGFALADGGVDVPAFWDTVVPELRERFEYARDIAAVRLARLSGEDPPALEAAQRFATLNAYARLDPDIFRAAFRRIGFLEGVGPLDPGLQERIESLPAPAQPAVTLSRDELLAALSSA
jgi:2-polyprenyl-6-methoxyphenol hydroxylase-like FAD-dependent oxidoreductase